MSILANKINFVVLVSVNEANPNGDPLGGNRPRTDYNGHGEMSNVCIKRKIRNRLQDMGEFIYVQANDRSDDGFKSLKERAEAKVGKNLSENEFKKIACENWIDVRAFGGVFAFKGPKNKDEKESNNGVSVGIRGPVTIQDAKSISTVDIVSKQITKSVNGEPSDKKGTDTMGMRHNVYFGLYKITGSINVRWARETGLTVEDTEKIKEALVSLFMGDVCQARPDGSMEVVTLYWWVHNDADGQYSAREVYDSIKVTLKEDVLIPESVDDYNIVVEKLEGLEPEILKGKNL